MDSRYERIAPAEGASTRLDPRNETPSNTPIHSAPPPPDKASLVEDGIQKRSTAGIMNLLTDAAVIVLPLAILGFLATVWLLDGKPVVGSTLDIYENIINVLASVFPILFAAIVGRLMAAVARCKLEKGCEMGRLEQILGSRTVGSTLITAFELRSATILSLGLIFIWAFSPAGTQSILRMLSTRSSYASTSRSITYFDTDAQSSRVGLVLSTDTRKSHESVDSVASLKYATQIMVPESTLLSPMDLWGNVKIPMTWPDSWQKTTPEGDADFHYYSSLAGIAVANLSSGNSSFSMETSFTTFDCDDLSAPPSRDSGDAPFVFVGGEETPITDPSLNSTIPNGTWYGYAGDDTGRFSDVNWAMAVDRLVDPFWYQRVANESLLRPAAMKNEVGIEVGPTRLLFQTIYPKLTAGVLQTTCSVRMKYVESRVHCTSLVELLHPSCRVVEQRLSQKEHASELISHLSFPQVLRLVSQRFPGGMGLAMDEFTDMALHYLTDPRMRTLDTIRPLQDMDGKAFGIRFSQLFNTFIIASQLQRAGSNGDPFSPDAEGVVNTVSAPGRVRRATEVFSISRPWMIASIVCCGGLLIGGIASVIFTHKTYGPDVLGYASTIVRGSRFMELPPGTAWEDGIDVTRAMQHQRIRLGLTQAGGTGMLQLGVSSEGGTERIKDALRWRKRGGNGA